MKLEICKYDNCRAVAKEAWANIGLCYFHYDKIKHETLSYYNKRIMKSERYHYAVIEALVKKGRLK